MMPSVVARRAMPAAFALLILLGGCAQNQSLYDWGSYQPGLLLQAKGAETPEQFAQRLQETITRAEATDRVPPGLYAEYGFVLLELGRGAQAAPWFQKEWEKWPESRILMALLLDRASAAAPTAPAPPLPMTPDAVAPAPLLPPAAPAAPLPPGPARPE